VSAANTTSVTRAMGAANATGAVNALPRGHAARLRALHWVARAALRVRPPLQAKAVVDRLASAFPRLGGVDDARAAVRELYPAGSCLSRALAVAAALPSAEVVIGVYPPSATRVVAHAWLEIDTVRIDTTLGDTQLPDELARLPPANQLRRARF
jgi:hypothetical protein